MRKSTEALAIEGLNKEIDELALRIKGLRSAIGVLEMIAKERKIGRANKGS